MRFPRHKAMIAKVLRSFLWAWFEKGTCKMAIFASYVFKNLSCGVFSGIFPASRKIFSRFFTVFLTSKIHLFLHLEQRNYFKTCALC